MNIMRFPAVGEVLLTTLVFTCLQISCHGQKRATFATICEKSYVINISNGTFDTNTKHIIYENVTYSPDKYFKRDDALMGCVCDVQLCVSKCCKAGHSKINDTCSPGFPDVIKVDLYHDNLELAESNVRHTSIEEWQICSGIFPDEGEKLHVLKDGRLYYPNDDKYFDIDEYCIGQYGIDSTVNTFLCYNEDASSSEEVSTANKYGMLISIPFLFVTLMVYVILPDKKIQTKCLMAYVTSLMLAYSFLVYLYFNSSPEGIACEIIAACGIYFFMATFCWMNISCIDMYWTFSGRRGVIKGSSSKWKQFGMYCAFANGAPLIILGIIFGVNTKSFQSSWYYPALGDGQCWLRNGMAQLLYFYGPMAVLLLINTCLFIFTAVTIHRNLAESQRMMQSNESRKHYDSNKQDYKLYIKLFIAMGINWIMEFISWIVDWYLDHRKIPELWYITDFCNASYGFFIFFIFIFKRTTWIKLKQRYYIFTGRPNMARALSTRTTSGYQMSQTEKTTVEYH